MGGLASERPHLLVWPVLEVGESGVTRIVTWNMSYWARSACQRAAAWEFLRSLQPDFALVQEAVPPQDLPPSHCVYRRGGIGSRRPWGSGVVSFSGAITEITTVISPHGSRVTQLHRTHPGSVAVAGTEDDLTLMSVYGLIDDGYAVTTVHRQLSDLTPLLDTKYGRRVVLAGDLNVTTQFEEPHRSRHRNVLDRIETLGLRDALGLERPTRGPLSDCPCADSTCRHIQTLRHPKSTVPWQNDYCFVSNDLVSRVSLCRPVDDGQPDPWSFSDHCPLLLELEEAHAS